MEGRGGQARVQSQLGLDGESRPAWTTQLNPAFKETKVVKEAGEMLPWIRQTQQARGSEFEFPALTKLAGMSLQASNSRVGGEVETGRSQGLPGQLA